MKYEKYEFNFETVPLKLSGKKNRIYAIGLVYL